MNGKDKENKSKFSTIIIFSSKVLRYVTLRYVTFRCVTVLTSDFSMRLARLFMSDLASGIFESSPCRPFSDILKPFELKMPE